MRKLSTKKIAFLNAKKIFSIQSTSIVKTLLANLQSLILDFALFLHEVWQNFKI